MKEIQVDVAVLGAGTAGLAAYRAAKANTERVVMVEGGPYGTTCARVGCMPSKLLLAAAEASHEVRHAHRFGVNIEGEVSVDGRAVLQRVRSERDRFVGFVLEGVDAISESDKVRGFARFTAPKSLEVSLDGAPGSEPTTRIAADRVVIATGSAPAIPPPFRAAGSRLVVNDDVFEWEELPKSVAVFGPGVIGLELGQALHRLGVGVKMFGVGNVVGPLSDPKVAETTRRIFGEEFYLDADVRGSKIEETRDGVAVTYLDHKGNEVTETFDYLLAATGRRPNLGRLGLEATGLELGVGGVPAFDSQTMRCGGSHIFIAGDVDNQRPLLHEAADEGKIAGQNAGRYPDVRAGHRRAPLGIVFSDPQIAVVGEGLAKLEARAEADGPIVAGEVSFGNQGRARVMLKNRGLLRVYARREDGRFLGAEMVGPRAEHIGHLLAWALQAKLTVTEMLDMPFYHPVVEEGLRTALRELAQRLAEAK